MNIGIFYINKFLFLYILVFTISVILAIVNNNHIVVNAIFGTIAFYSGYISLLGLIFGRRSIDKNR